MLFNKEFFKKHAGGISAEEIDFWVRVCNQHVVESSTEVTIAAPDLSSLFKSAEKLEQVIVTGWQKMLGPIPPKDNTFNSFLADIWEKQKHSYEWGFRDGNKYGLSQAPAPSVDEALGYAARISRLEKQLAKCKEQRDYYGAAIADELNREYDPIGDDQELEAIR